MRKNPEELKIKTWLIEWNVPKNIFSEIALKLTLWQWKSLVPNQETDERGCLINPWGLLDVIRVKDYLQFVYKGELKGEEVTERNLEFANKITELDKSIDKKNYTISL